MQHKSTAKRRYFIAASAGVASGAAASIVTCPLDVVKTRLQLQAGQDAAGRAYRGTLPSLRRIVVEEGVRGLFHGLWPTMVGLTLNWAVYFACYNTFKTKLANRHSHLTTDASLNHLCAAVGAGAVTAVATSPLWVVKTRFQTHSMPHPVHGVKKPTVYTGVLRAMHKTARKEGIAALWKGIGVSMFGLIHVAIQFPLYEKLKLELRDSSGQLSVPRLIFASAVSKVGAVAFSYPTEVIRSQQQHATGSLTLPNAFRSVYKDGFAGFYRGMSTNLLRVVPSCIITFLTYELVSSKLKALLLEDEENENL